MESVIQRLRASRAAASDDNLKTGIERGRDWAARRAKWEELRRLYEEFGGYTNAQWDDFCSLEPDAYGHIGALVRVIAPPGFFERSLAEEFGQNVFEEEYPAAELIQGFCVGALEVLAEVEAKL